MDRIDLVDFAFLQRDGKEIDTQVIDVPAFGVAHCPTNSDENAARRFSAARQYQRQ